MAKETKIFDPADGFAPLTDPAVITDCTVAKRGGQWWMFVCGQVKGKEGIHLFSASLPEESPLSARGWRLTATPEDCSRIALLAGQGASGPWDLKGGRHCPCYVSGWDPKREAWVERIYYAGGAEHRWGPYTIGYLEWDGAKWLDQDAPAFTANEDWEHGSVFEPNLIYDDRKWKLWYAAGSNQEDYLVQGYAESADGRGGWSKHKMFRPPEEKVFDFNVTRTQSGWEAVFSRVHLGTRPAPTNTGLWWCRAERASSDFGDWGQPVQILTGGPWKPCLQYGEADPGRMFVFFDGVYAKKEPGGFPYVFTLGCLEIERPE